MLERDLQRRIKRRYEAQGCLVLKLTSLGRYGTKGWPDLLVLSHTGCAEFVEVKVPGGQLTPVQRLRHQQLQALGFEVRVETA